MFRLHIDIPLDMTEDWAAQLSKTITAHLETWAKENGMAALGLTKIQYRLADDTDRNIRNYLVKDEQGHVSTKKSIIEIKSNCSEG